MKFEVGNKVLFKKDNQKGIIIKVNSPYMYTVLTDDGFEIMVSIDNLVKVVSGSDKINSYGTIFSSKESNVHLRKSKKNQKRKNTLKVDLHIELLSDNYHYLDNFEIVQIQINECYKSVEKALNSDIYKLEIIHGIGEGVLRNEVHAILRKYNLRFYLSKDGGATEIFL